MEKLENKLENSGDNFVEGLLENYPLNSRRVQRELKNLKRKLDEEGDNFVEGLLENYPLKEGSERTKKLETKT